MLKKRLFLLCLLMPTLVWAKGAPDNPCEELAQIADFGRMLACIDTNY